VADVTVEPEGSIEIKTSKHGIEAGVTLYFVFDGDWANMYDDIPADEEEARSWFVHEVQLTLEDKRNATRQDDQAERSSDTENRGA
jgi:hypothetical protein